MQCRCSGAAGWGVLLLYLGGEGLAGVPSVRRGGAGAAVLIPAVLGRAGDARQHFETLCRRPPQSKRSPRVDRRWKWNGIVRAPAPEQTHQSCKQASIPKRSSEKSEQNQTEASMTQRGRGPTRINCCDRTVPDHQIEPGARVQSSDAGRKQST